MTRAGRKPDVERAIWRSREARAARSARRRRLALLAGLFAVSLAGAGTFAIKAFAPDAMIEAAVSNARSLADLLSERSPGTRSEAQLIKLKHEKIMSPMRPAAMPRMHQARKPKIAMVDFARLLDLPPAPLVGEAPPSLSPLEAQPPSIETILIPPGANSPPESPPPGSPPIGTPPGTIPPGTSPPGLTPPGMTPPTVLVPIPSAVPEPESWAMMLLGFAFVGWRARAFHQPAHQPA